MKVIENHVTDMERAFYGEKGLLLRSCSFDGPADGESALKECRDIQIEDSFCNLRYPFWHDHGLKIRGSELTPLCRAALWYSDHVEIVETKLHGIKALRECGDVAIKNCDINSDEFGWSVRNLSMENCAAESEYFLLRGEILHLKDIQFKGKYSFQYTKNVVIENSVLDTKDAFWHAQNVDSSFQYHLNNARKNGITRAEMAEILTHAAFYVGWPKAWAAFNMAKEVYQSEETDDGKSAHQNGMIFPIGEPNDGFAQYFVGQSYLAPVSTNQVGIFNVTFEPGCRNNWHIHRADRGGGQILICVAGQGYYQEWGKEARKLQPGDVVNIPAGVKHWHGAAPDSWFSHLAVEVPGEACANEWLEPVSDTQYSELNQG